MPKADVTVRSAVPESFRAAKVQGMFDVPKQAEQVLTFTADLSSVDERDWNVGAIVGASGSGKSTLARNLWPEAYVAAGFDWPEGCVLDGFPKRLRPEQITSALTAVGFSSPPAWLRPYRVLSTGQQHRADLARALVEHDDGLVVYDEFTSTVDRIVAKAASVAVARQVRRQGRRFVAVTCHKDVTPWLEADWVYDVDTGKLTWGSQRRPSIRLTVHEGFREAWTVFRGHHYLTGDLANAARVFLAYAELGDEPPALVGFFSIMPLFGFKGVWRGHRTVVLPDYQGLGLGNLMIESVAEQLWRREGKRFTAVTAAPSIIAHRKRRPEMWKMTMKGSMKPPTGRTSRSPAYKASSGRLTTSWSYIPEAMRLSPEQRSRTQRSRRARP